MPTECFGSARCGRKRLSDYGAPPCAGLSLGLTENTINAVWTLTIRILGRAAAGGAFSCEVTGLKIRLGLSTVRDGPCLNERSRLVDKPLRALFITYTFGVFWFEAFVLPTLRNCGCEQISLATLRDLLAKYRDGEPAAFVAHIVRFYVVLLHFAMIQER